MSAVPFKVRAIYEYSSPHDDDLSFPTAQVITVTEADDDDWYTGEYVDSTGKKHDGLFPRNFVEKYEPEIPSRPTRPARVKKDNEAPTPGATAATKQHIPAEPLAATEERQTSPERPTEVSSPALGNTASFPTRQPSSREPFSKLAGRPLEQPSIKPGSKDDPAESSDKAIGGSFKDRIAAFNKPAAPPVAPFKPGGQGTNSSTGFIKKPFVAPPPSRNAYVPLPRDPPLAQVYRKDEDPGLNETAEDSEASMPLPGERNDDVGEAQSKPTSLKDRIALLQKQQLEQAARHAEVAQKKDKPKRPSKKRTESHEPAEMQETPVEADFEDRDTSDTMGKKSVDFADDESEPPVGHSGRHLPSVAHMSTPPPPSRELMSDTNDADNSAGGDTEEAYDTSTSREDDREKSRRAPVTKDEESTGAKDEAHGSEEDHEDVEEEQDVDPEIRRRMEIRERMAKMSGGMGLMGMFGPPGGMPTSGKKNRAGGDADRGDTNSQTQPEAVERVPPVPIPGMSNIKMPEATTIRAKEDSSADEDASQTPSPEKIGRGEMSDEETTEALRPPPRAATDHAPLFIPQGRAVPPPPPRDSRTPPPAASTDRHVPEVASSPPQGRAAPPAPPRSSMPLSSGELSDDEMSFRGSPISPHGKPHQDSASQSIGLPPISSAPAVPPAAPGKESSLPSQALPLSPSAKEKRSSRGLPPLPPSSPATGSAPQFRGPPPPPPGQPPSRKSTSQSRNVPFVDEPEKVDDSEGEVTEYDGDYDTDIASSAKHKDALKSHARDSSFDEDTLLQQNSAKATVNPPGRAPPPLPNVSAPRDVPPPPPPPNQTSKHARRSGDMPRVAPPPIPPAKDALEDDYNNDYDPHQRHAPQQTLASATSQHAFSPITQTPEDAADDDLYDASPRSLRAPPLPAQGPPPPVPVHSAQPSQNAPRQSLEISRSQTTPRRSTDVPRPSAEHGFMATDVDLASSSQWYAQSPDVLPPTLQRRSDILFEVESSTSSKRGGKTTISKDVYILYMDYSQTIISASFDPSEPTNVSLEQRHERPPPPPRKDQLETASTQFGSRIASSAPSKANTTIGDGSPHALILDLLHPLSPSVLLPIGTRAYGAPVYANLANASTQQFDEIRPGDIVTFRNAKFAGHKGGLHTKYSMDVGKPDHVAVVADWDGTKKKIRVWEQKGKEVGKVGHAKVKEEGYRVADLKSGEVRVWRVMGRAWVGWEGGSK